MNAKGNHSFCHWIALHCDRITNEKNTRQVTAIAAAAATRENCTSFAFSATSRLRYNNFCLHHCVVVWVELVGLCIILKSTTRQCQSERPKQREKTAAAERESHLRVHRVHCTITNWKDTYIYTKTAVFLFLAFHFANIFILLWKFSFETVFTCFSWEATHGKKNRERQRQRERKQQ